MIAIPAIDLREGACVQLVGGRYEDERVRLPDPAAVAERWSLAGFRSLHVVDLDAATGRGDNRAAIEAVIAAARRGGVQSIQVGGGMATVDRIRDVLAAGADRIVVGTKGLEDPAWLAETAERFPGKLILAADVRGRDVVARGWAASTGRDVVDVTTSVSALPLAGLLVTAVHVEGQLAGPDLALVELVVGAARAPVQASGGIRDLADLRALASAGAAGAVIGMALYTGRLDAEAAAREFGT